MKRGLFNKSAILVIGTAVSQMIPLLSLPLLTKFYSPDSFSLLALYISFSAILAVISTGRYELSILKPKYEKDAYPIFALASGLSFIFSLTIFFITIILLVFKINIEYLSKHTDFSLMILPLGILNYSLLQVLSYWYSRKNKFKLISYIKIFQSIIVILFSLLLGYMGVGLNGLVISFAAGGAFTACIVLGILFRMRKILTLKSIINVARINNQFPKYLMFSALLDTFATQAPILFLSSFFSPFQVGSYSFASRIVTAPVSLLGGSIAQAFLQTFSKMLNEGKRIHILFKKTITILVTLSFLILGTTYLLAPFLFQLFFDPQWELAGKLASFLALASIPRFIVAPISASMIALGSIKLLVFWQFLYSFSTALFFYFFKSQSLLGLVSVYYIHEFILYSIYLFFIIRIIMEHHFKKIY
jgi:O-antigen/teichoic acid export membrane protein